MTDQNKTISKMETIDEPKAMLRQLVKQIGINSSNIKHILDTGEINGSLLTDIEYVAQKFHERQSQHSYSEQEVRNIIEIIKNRCEVMLAHGDRFQTKQECYDHNREVILNIKTDDLLKPNTNQ